MTARHIRTALSFVVVALLGTAARASDSAPAVILLPLAADGTVSAKQALGVSAQVRGAITPEVAQLLSSSADDDKQAGKCARDIACLAHIAELRGADLIGAGTVSPATDGLRVSLMVVAPGLARGATEALRRVEITLQGKETDARRLERLVRTAFRPSALRGAIAVTGEQGALVVLDDVMVGVLPLAPLVGLVEGDHRLVVYKDGSGEFRRTIAVVHGDTTTVKALLVDSEDAVVPSPQGEPGTVGLGVDVVVLGAIGAGLVLLGAVAGALSLRDSLEVEARAAASNLAFPTDSELYARGGLLSLAANGLYVAGAVAGGAAAALWVLE